MLYNESCNYSSIIAFIAKDVVLTMQLYLSKEDFFLEECALLDGFVFVNFLVLWFYEAIATLRF